MIYLRQPGMSNLFAVIDSSLIMGLIIMFNECNHAWRSWGCGEWEPRQ